MPYVTVYTCANCGAIFDGPGKYQRKHCSPECKNAAAWKRRKGGAGYWRQMHYTVRPVACVSCLSPLPPSKRKPRLYCSEKCMPSYSTYEPSIPRSVVCVTCGLQFTTFQPLAEACSRHCNDRSPKARERAAKRRGAGNTSPFTTAEIAERDGWMCGICGDRIPKRAKHPDGRSISLDHIIPLSEGGDHLPSNVQVAHLKCNLSKGVRAVGCQLRLV